MLFSSIIVDWADDIAHAAETMRMSTATDILGSGGNDDSFVDNLNGSGYMRVSRSRR